MVIMDGSFGSHYGITPLGECKAQRGACVRCVRTNNTTREGESGLVSAWGIGSVGVWGRALQRVS